MIPTDFFCRSLLTLIFMQIKCQDVELQNLYKYSPGLLLSPPIFKKKPHRYFTVRYCTLRVPPRPFWHHNLKPCSLARHSGLSDGDAGDIKNFPGKG